MPTHTCLRRNFGEAGSVMGKKKNESFFAALSDPTVMGDSKDVYEKNAAGQPYKHAYQAMAHEPGILKLTPVI